MRFITFAIASTDETIDHLETLFETASFTDQVKYNLLLEKANLLGKKLIKFLESIESQHLSKK